MTYQYWLIDLLSFWSNPGEVRERPVWSLFCESSQTVLNTFQICFGHTNHNILLNFLSQNL